MTGWPGSKGTKIALMACMLAFANMHAHGQFAVDNKMKATETIKSPDTGRVVKDFSLLNYDGRHISLSDYKDAKGFIVVFTCNHCPFAKLYTARLNALNAKYKPQGFPLLAINPMDSVLYEEEELVNLRKKALSEKFNFPYLQDASQAVAREFNANKTPQAFVIVRAGDSWAVKYCGGIDDNGAEPAKATPLLANAVDDLLKGVVITKPKSESIGCKIMYRKAKS